MSDLQAEIDRIDAEIEVLQRVRTRLAAQIVRAKYFAPELQPTPAAEPNVTPVAPSPKAQPRQSQRGSSLSKARQEVLRAMNRLGPATYTAISAASGKAGSTLQKTLSQYGQQLPDRRWMLNEEGERVLEQNFQTSPNPNQSGGESWPSHV